MSSEMRELIAKWRSDLIVELENMGEQDYDAGCCNANYPIAAATRCMRDAAKLLRALSRGVPEDVEQAAYWLKRAMGTGGPAKAATVQIAYGHAAAIVRHLEVAIAAQRKEGE